MNEAIVVERSTETEAIGLTETEMAIELKEFCKGRGWTADILPYRGMLDCMVIDDEFFYMEHTDQKLIKEAEKRLFAIGCNFPIAQVIYGHEVDKRPERNLEDIVKIALKSAWRGLQALGLALVTLDPCLIVVLDDDQHTWVRICTWL